MYALNFHGGNTNNILQANNFEHFTPYTDGFYDYNFGIFKVPADIIFGSYWPDTDNNVVIGGGSSSGKLHIIDTGTGNLVGNNNVAHTDPQLMQTYMDAIKDP